MSKLYEKDVGEKISKIFHNIEWSNQRKERLRHLESIQQIMIEQQRNMQDLKEVVSNFEVGKKDIEKKLSDLKRSSESVSKSLWRRVILIWVLAAVIMYLGWLVYCDGVDYDKLHDEYTQCMNDRNQMIEQFSLFAQQYIQSDAQEKMSMCEEKMKKLMNQIKGLKKKLKTQLEIQAATKAELLVCEENIETLQRIKGLVETHGNLPNNLADNKRDEPTLSIVLLLALCCFVAITIGTILYVKKSQQKQMGKNMDQYGSVSENIKPDDLVSEDEEMICCTCETEFTEEVTQFTPAVDKNGSIDNYRFWFQTGGKYRCEITNLIFHVSSPAEVLYHTDQWESHLLNPTGLQPASPLYNIQCPTGSLEFLYLPHCECFTAGDPGPLLAAHVMQDNIELLNATSVSHTHVKIPVSELSPFGLLKKWFSSMVHGQVLLFLKHGRKQNRMNVFLLPKNVPLQQVKEQQSFSLFIETSSDCILKKYKNYSISCDLEAEVEIQPLKQVFLCSYGPNFFPTFEMFLDFTVTDLKLKLLEEGNKELWIRRVELLDTSPSADSNVSAPLVPSPENNTLVNECGWKKALFDIIEELTEGEYKKMKMLLSKEIPLGKLEKTDQESMVHLIISQCGLQKSIQVTQELMRQIPRNDERIQSLLQPFLEQTG